MGPFSTPTDTKKIEERLDQFLASVDRMERQTDRLICLTWALVALTVALLLFTGYLCYDAHQHHERDNFTDQHSTQQR